MHAAYLYFGTVIKLNKKKKTITLDQAEQTATVLSYTPYVTRKPVKCAVKMLVMWQLI